MLASYFLPKKSSNLQLQCQIRIKKQKNFFHLGHYGALCWHFLCWGDLMRIYEDVHGNQLEYLAYSFNFQ